MTLDAWLVTLGALGAAVVLGSQALRHIPLTGPLLALGVGAALGPEGLAVFRIPDGHAVLNTVSEIAMAIALMAVALRYPFSDVAKLARPLTLLLTVGMVGMAATVALLAWGLLGLEPAHAWLLGAVLAPTDPVLSSSIVTGDPAEKDIPYRLRRLLSAESGANDGLAFPLVVLGVVLMREEGLGRFITEGLIGVAIAVVAGIAIGWAAGALMLRSEEHSYQSSSCWEACSRGWNGRKQACHWSVSESPCCSSADCPSSRRCGGLSSWTPPTPCSTDGSAPSAWPRCPGHVRHRGSRR